MCFAQAGKAIEEFHKAADTWGLTTSVLLSLVIALMAAVVMIAIWIKPKLDKWFDKHNSLVDSLIVRLGIGEKFDERLMDVLAKIEKKIEDWPSDLADGVCHVCAELEKAGLNTKNLERLLRLRDKRRDADRGPSKAKETDHG